MLYFQDGADFYNAETNRHVARISEPFERRNDWYSLEAALEAEQEFLRAYPNSTRVDPKDE